MADDALRLMIDGKTYEMNPDELTLGEVEMLEDTMDAPLTEIDFGRAKATRALVYLLVHRENPSFTPDDAGKVKLSALGDQAAPPVGAKAKAKRPTRAAASGS